MAEVGAKTIRNDRFCSKINAVYADLDVAKKGDTSTEEEREKGKQVLLDAMAAHCPPNKIIVTKNGLQPLWYLTDTSPENKTRAKNVINGIIAWSKGHGSAGDEVKDISRVLRLPGYYHMKSEPFMITILKGGRDEKYSYEELEAKFPYTPAPEYVPPVVTERAHNNQMDEVERLDFPELVCKAFSSVGRPASFDKQKRLILDGRVTGTHLGKVNGGDFLASSSHEPFVGNRTTAVANILGITYSEAFKWICDEYHIEFKREERPKKEPVIRETFKKENMTKEKKSHFCNLKEVAADMRSNEKLVSNKEVISTGFPVIDKCMGGIFPSSLIIVGSRTGHGKSEVCKNIAMDAAANGKKVLLFDFENDKGEMLAREIKSTLGKAGVYVSKSEIKTKEFWVRHKARADAVVDGLQDIMEDNLLFYSSDEVPTIDEFLAVLDSVDGVDLIVIDHLHYFSMDDSGNEAKQISDIMRKVRLFTKIKRIPVVIASHVKNPPKERPPIESDLFGSSNISKEAECVLMPYRLPEEEREGEINTRLVVAKNRQEGVLRSFPATYNTKTSTLTVLDSGF